MSVSVSRSAGGAIARARSRGIASAVAGLFALAAAVPRSAEAAPSMRVLPLGDSITYGSSTVGGYRLPLYSMLTNVGFNVDMVGTQTGNSGTMGEPQHEGHSGWRIDQIDSIILGVFNQSLDPDVVLVLIGTNDFGQNYDTANATNRLDALIEKMATNRPFAKIVVANLLQRGEPTDTAIQTSFNPAVPFIVSNHAARGQQVYFTNLRADLTLADTYDNLHPNDTGYAKMATNWFGVITNLFSPSGSADAPAMAYVNGLDRTGVRVTYSKPVSAASATNIVNYTLDGGLTVLSATYNATTERDVVLVTSTQAASTVYTLTVSNVTDQTAAATPIAAGATALFTSSPPRGVFNNVPDAAEYSIVYSLDIPALPNYSTDLLYDVDFHERVPAFDRVAYYLELQKPGEALQYVWVAMDPFTNSAAAIGVPTFRSGAIFQQPVTHMDVLSSVASVVTGAGLSGGNIEFWPWNYSAPNALGVTNATDARYDQGDTRATSGNYGSMQVHNHDAAQTVFAFNHWNSGTAPDLGIGNGTGAEPDWTFLANGGAYTVRRLQVLARPAANAAPAIAGCASRPGYTSVVVTATKPLADDATNVAHYTVSGGLSVLSAALDPVSLQRVTLTTSLQSPGTRYTISFNGLTDRTPSALAMAAGTTARFVTTAIGRSGVLNNVPEARDYTLVYSIALPTAAAYNNTGVPYDIDNHSGVGAFSRVAYYLELVEPGTSTNFVWAEMDPFTQDAGKIGIPALEAAALFQQAVSNLTVFSSVDSATAGDFAAGQIEFWPYDYTQVNDPSFVGASSANFDWGDHCSTSSGNYGSMQIHNGEWTQTVMAVNNFGGGGSPLCLGLGTYTTNAGSADWTHIRNATNFSVRTLQVYVLQADTNAPTVLSAVLKPDGEHLVVRFSEPLADGSALPGNFSLSGGLSVLAAETGADPAEVILTITPAAPGVVYTLTIGNVRDRSANANPIAPGTTVGVTGSAPPARVVANVPEAAAYTLACQLDLPVRNAGLNRAGTTYDVDNRAGIGPFSRVAYYLELAAPGGATNWVYVSMDAFTREIGKIGIPDLPSGGMFQQVVTNMNVFSSDPSIVTGTGIATGNIEFWPWSYGQALAAAVTNGSASAYDWNDTTNNLVWAGEGYSCMQVHNHGAYGTGQVIFAYNNWGRWASGVTADLGIGTRPASTGMDWTSAANGSGWFVKNLYVLVLQPNDTTPPAVALALPSMNRTNLLVRFDEPVTAASAVPGNFTLTGGLLVQGASLRSNLREVLLTTTPQSPSTAYTLTVNNVMDRSVNSNTIPPGTTAGFTTPADAPVFGRVAEASGYELLYHLPLPTTVPRYNVNGVSYTVDQRPLIDGAFDRIAYYMELATSAGAATNWVYASMNAFTPRLERVGVPALGTGAGFQQVVTNMNVRSSLASIVTGDGIATGNIEFWPWNYGGATTTVINTGTGGAYDWNDSYTVGSGQHASMQVHNWGANATGQVLFGYSNWGGNSTGNPNLGLGTQAGTQNMDWTFNTANATGNAVKNLYVLVRRGDPVPPVVQPPTVVMQPLSKRGGRGESIRLAGAAVGSGPMTYQWRQYGVTLAGETNTWLEFAVLQDTDAGDYDLIVSNAAGSTTSLVARLLITTTAVVLHQFVAIAEEGGVVLRWRTASEVGTTGFDVYRRDGGSWTHVNTERIAAVGAPQGGLGASYRLPDPGAAPGGTYEYKIVETVQDGSQREYGPYERTATAFEMTSPIRATPEGMEVRWLSRQGEVYRVLRSTNLVDWAPHAIGGGVTATPPENIFVDTNAAPMRVYRVELEE